MAAEKYNAKNSDTSFNMQDDPVQPSSSIKRFENCHFGKTLAYRAVYGGSCSSGGGAQRSRSRKVGGASIPSRLSKVSVVTDN